MACTVGLWHAAPQGEMSALPSAFGSVWPSAETIRAGSSPTTKKQELILYTISGQNSYSCTESDHFIESILCKNRIMTHDSMFWEKQSTDCNILAFDLSCRGKRKSACFPSKRTGKPNAQNPSKSGVS